MVTGADVRDGIRFVENLAKGQAPEGAGQKAGGNFHPGSIGTYVWQGIFATQRRFSRGQEPARGIP